MKVVPTFVMILGIVVEINFPFLLRHDDYVSSSKTIESKGAQEVIRNLRTSIKQDLHNRNKHADL